MSRYYRHNPGEEISHDWTGSESGRITGGELASSTGSASECCADWTPGITKLNGPIMLQSIRAGKDLYTGKPFLFCPWCGQKRPNVVFTCRDPKTSRSSSGYAKAELQRRVDYCEDQWIGAKRAIKEEAWRLAADLMEKCASQMALCIHDSRVLSHTSAISHGGNDNEKQT